MTNRTLTVVGALGFLLTAGCHKAVPVAAQTPISPRSTPVAAAPERVAKPAASVSRPVQTAEPRRSAVMSPQERATLTERLARLEDALFDLNKSTIRSDATTALKEDVDVIRGILSNYPAQKLVIEGHADERGSAEYNLALGDQRARAVDQFLMTMGLPETRLTMISYGKEHPICTDSTEGCWQRNRRAHITAAP